MKGRALSPPERRRLKERCKQRDGEEGQKGKDWKTWKTVDGGKVLQFI